MLLRDVVAAKLKAQPQRPRRLRADLVMPLAEKLRPRVRGKGRLRVAPGTGTAGALPHVFGIHDDDPDSLFREFLAGLDQQAGATRQDEVDACGMLEWLHCACVYARPPDVGHLFALQMRCGQADPTFRLVLFVVALLLAADGPVDLLATTPITLDGESLLLLDAKVTNTVIDVCPHPWNDYLPGYEPMIHRVPERLLFHVNAGRMVQRELLQKIDICWTALAGQLARLVQDVPVKLENGKVANTTIDRLLIKRATDLDKSGLDLTADAAVREFVFRLGCTGSVQQAIRGSALAMHLVDEAALAFCEAAAALVVPNLFDGSLPRAVVDAFTKARLNDCLDMTASPYVPPPAAVRLLSLDA
jgi:hypothetical protein